MKKLIETILKDRKLNQFHENSKVKELIELAINLPEEEFNDSMAELKKRHRELYEYVCKEVAQEGQKNAEMRMTMSITPVFQNGSSCSYLNSPEKQQSEKSGTRWSVPREERRRIVELMERQREEQKKRRKQDWCRLERVKSEFEEEWEGTGGLKDADVVRMRIDEGEEMRVPDSKRSRRERENGNGSERVSEREIKRETTVTHSHSHHSHTTSHTHIPHTPHTPHTTHTSQHNSYTRAIVDFDCIEHLLINLKNDHKSHLSPGANYILSCADHLYKSELMFYTDLKDFDQPNFKYYAKEDDLTALKYYEFHNDDLGKWARNGTETYKDNSRKFYRERAFRHRYISRKPYELFFNDYTLRRLREEVDNLDKNCREFHFWMSRAIAQKGTIFVSSAPLLRSFALLLVLSRLVQFHPFDISNSIWSCAKYGPEWTFREILATHTGNVEYLTLDKSSKLSIEAAHLGLLRLRERFK